MLRRQRSGRVMLGVLTVCLAAVLAAMAQASRAPVALLPDAIVWASVPHGFMYRWRLDRHEQPGRVLLRLSTAIPNQGAGPLELIGGEVLDDGTQAVYQRVYYDDGSYEDRLAGTFVYHPDHHHFHFEGYAEYRLRAFTPEGGVGEVVAGGDKVSFCLVDVLPYNRKLPGFPRFPEYLTCNTDRQGISVGWADVYDKSLPDQWIDVTDVPDGRYWLEVEVDPDDRLLESNESNNLTRIPILLRK
jgi:hypothetical protein